MKSSQHQEPLHFKADRRGGQRPSTTVRRHAERLYGSCQAIVRGVDAQGQSFTEATTLENVSAGGLYVRLQRSVSPGTRLFVVFAFSSVALQDAQAPRVAARGQVCRVETIEADAAGADAANAAGADAANAQKASGVGLRFQHHRFL
jgi:hypothetical protein